MLEVEDASSDEQCDPGMQALDGGSSRVSSHHHSRELSLIVIIPALNEETTVGDVVRRVPREVHGIKDIRVVVVDDGSDDATSEVAKRFGAEVIKHSTNFGVGAAIQTGLSFGIDEKVDLIVTLDADGQFDPCDIPKVVEPVIRGQAAFSTASRFLDRSLTPTMPRIRLWGNRAMSWLISRIVGQRYFDVSCGMRCYSQEAALRLNLLGAFTYTQEVFLNLSFKRLAIAEVPVRVAGQRSVGRSRVAHNLMRYAIRALQIIVRAYRDYHPLRFFGRIAVLFASLGLGLGGFLLLHYLNYGAFSPHKWAGFGALFLVGLALMSLHIGVIGDMMNRHRIYLEEILLRQRLSDTKERESGGV